MVIERSDRDILKAFGVKVGESQMRGYVPLPQPLYLLEMSVES
jgi:hypothetical protein